MPGPLIFNKPQAPQGPAQFAPESQARPDPWPVRATEGLMGALGMGDSSTASKLGELVGAAAPFVGPALKGLGVAAPLISIYKTAEGVPSAALREAGTQNFLDMAKDLPGKLQIAAERFAQQYPRVAAHLRPQVASAPPTLPDADAFVTNWPGQVKAPMDMTFTPAGISYIESKPGIAEASRMLYHEATHGAQHLGNKNFPELYKAANAAVGYDLNPFEMRATRVGTRAAGGLVTRGNPTAIEQLKTIASFPGEPESYINSVLARRQATPMASEPMVQAASQASKPTARYIGHQEGLGPLYDIKGGPSDGSTVSAETLKKLGIDIPPTPKK